MTQAIKNTYSITKEYSSFLTYAFLAGSIFMAVIYALNVYSIVSKTVAVKNIEKEVAKTQSVVQDLDAEYIVLTNKITPDVAKHYGLHEGIVSAYIQRSPSVGRIQVAKQDL